MSEKPVMPLWVSDFLGDTLDLDAAEIGAYMLLLMAQWNRGGASLPADAQKLKRVARCGRNWPKVWGAISRYFEEDEDGVYSKRARLESQIVAAKSEVNRQNGALGGRAKSLKRLNGQLANATNSPERKPSIPEPEPEPCKEEAKASSTNKRGSRLPNDWELPREWGQWALSQQWPEPVIREQAERFRDYWIAQPGQKGVKLDWQATWRNWMRNSNAPKIHQGGQHGRPASKSDERLNAFVAGARGTS